MEKCIVCENNFENYGKEIICPTCQEKIKTAKKIDMLEKASKKLQAQKYREYYSAKTVDVSDYANNVRSRILNGIDSFDSIPEVMVAIQLERLGISYCSQKKISGCKVDFLIPSIKIILEIDGELYHKDSDKSFLRDRRIMASVGEEWEIVHIAASMVPKYTWKVKDALKFVVEYRNFNGMFRNSNRDSDFLELFRDFDFTMSIRRNKNNGNKTVFESNRKIRINDKK